MFYVYAHLRETDKSVFYIGKGSGDRAYVKNGRNAMWNSVFKKHGCLVVILSEWECEEEAFKEEELLINKIGIENLTNMAHGGKGAKGVEFSKERKSRARKHLEIYNKNCLNMVAIAQAKSRKRIYTECGRSFLGAAKAREWMVNDLLINDANQQRINRAAKVGGNYKGIYFRYKDVSFMKNPEVGGRSIPVGNSDGEVFPSIRKAVESMVDKGLKASSASIHGAINGRHITAAGKRWGYVVDGEIVIKEFDRKTKLKKIRRSDGMIFESLKAAADFMENGSNANKNISLAARGKTKTAYGYGWEYL